MPLSNISIGPVSLVVPNLERSRTFYTEVLGFNALSETTLGAPDGRVLLELDEDPASTRPSRRSPGLFHFAVLFPTRAALGRSLTHLLQKGYKLSGAGDHLVSEALYLDDPDGNGIELYYDRPRETWQFNQGRVVMDSLPVDLDSLIAEGKTDATPWIGIPAGTVMGHVHLKVNDVEAAGRFYVDIIGFNVMATWQQALFVSAGGYHHHIGLNTWTSAGSPPPPKGSSGLKGFTIDFANQQELDEVLQRLTNAGIEIDRSQHDPFVRDPSNNGVWLSTLAT